MSERLPLDMGMGGRLTAAPQDLIRSISAGRWISLGTLAVGRANFGPAGLSIGAMAFGSAAALTLEGDRLTILRDGWRMEVWRRYRPLVYYAAFGSDEVFACLRVALLSLFEFGRYDGEVLLLTDAAHAAWPDCLPEALRPRVTVRTIEARDILDWTLARYHIVGLPELATYRPILYLDIDVMANAPVTPILRRLAVSTLLHAPAEHPVTHPEDWYGASLLAADDVKVSPQRPGFTTGIMGFPDIGTVRPLFAIVPKLAQAHALAAGNRRSFACFDQPFANYAAIKSGGVELSLFREFLDNRWFWLDRPTQRRGLVHFTGGTDKAVPKLTAMSAYLDQLHRESDTALT